MDLTLTPGTANSLDDLLSDVPSIMIDLEVPDVSTKDLFAENKRKGWDKSIEARCDFERKVRLTKRSGVFFISIWQKSVYGRTLTDIKSDDSMIIFFAQNITPLIAEVIGKNLQQGLWAMATTPKRRHKVRNFATLISEKIARLLGIPFYEDVASCQNRQRVNAVFTLNILPKEPNLIIFDDFVTTGQTLKAMDDLLSPLGKNLIYFTGINNAL